MRPPNKSDRLYQQVRQRISRMQDGETFPTIRQLMAEYGVSQSTVTPAVNLLKEIGLLQAHVGRGSFVCRTSRKPHMLMLQSDWHCDTFPRIVRAVREAATAAGFHFEHIPYHYQEDITLELPRFNADIIVIDSISIDLLSSEQIHAITHSPAPVILCRSSIPIRNVNYVCGDNSAAGAAAAAYLYRMGHRNLGVLVNEPHLYTSDAFYRGFVNAANSHGCQVEVLDCDMRPGETPDRQIERFMREFRDGKYNFTALYPISIIGALLVKENMDRLGLRIPEDLSMISTGSIPDNTWLTLLEVDFTEYRDQVVQMAQSILRNAIAERDRQIEIPFQIVERTSVRKIEKLTFHHRTERITYA